MGAAKGTYGEDAARLMDWAKRRLEVNSDGALSRKAGIDIPRLSHLRSGREKLGNAVLIKIHILTGVPVTELRLIAKGEKQDAAE